MSLSAEAIQALIASGVTAEQLGAAVLAEQARDERAAAEKRAKDAKRKAEKRAALKAMSEPVLECPRTTPEIADFRGHDGTSADPFLDKEVSPTPPSRKPNLPGDILPRAREATAASLPGADRLARFWEAYPRKVGKRDAVQAYLRAVQRVAKAEPGSDPHAVIAEGLDRLLAGWADREPELIPHPATWLNRDGWEDQPDSPRQPRLIHDRGPGQSAYQNKLHAVAGAMREALGSG